MRDLCVPTFILLALVGQLSGAQNAPSPAINSQISVAPIGIGDVTANVLLSGTATWIAGSQRESGKIQLTIKADGSSEEKWDFPHASRSYVQGPVDLANFKRTCSFTTSDGKDQRVPIANCLQPAPWFFPAFALQPAFSKNSTVADETDDSDSAKGLKKLSYSVSTPAALKANKPLLDRFTRIQKATAFSIYYDTRTSLPKRLVYQQAFDRDEDRTVEIRIDFGDYGPESGLIVPHHIERYVQNSLQLDVTVTAVTTR